MFVVKILMAVRFVTQAVLGHATVSGNAKEAATEFVSVLIGEGKGKG
jgi:hypothetical protein